MVVRPSRWARHSQASFPDGQECSKGPPGGSGVVGKPSRMAGSCREAISKGWEWLGMVERPSRRTRSGREAIPDGRELSGGHLGGPGVAGNGRDALLAGRE